MSTFAPQNLTLLHRLLVRELAHNPRLIDNPVLLLFFFSF